MKNDRTEENNNDKRVNDRVGEYLVRRLDKMYFDELSDGYLEKADIAGFMKGVPIPFKAEELAGGSTSTLTIARNMAYVMGCDRNFKYKAEYLQYVEKFFPGEFEKALMNEGVKAAEKKDPEEACVFFRAALQVRPESRDALFLYARALKDAYETGEGEDYVGTFKAESISMFEKLTMHFPDFDKGHYFLGYAYLNLGLYVKAKLAFQDLMKTTNEDDLKSEVSDVLLKLEDPCAIESAINDIMAGRYDNGTPILEEYSRDQRFITYWPMWYWLGVSYRNSSDNIKAESAFKKALSYSPSNPDIMSELAEIYDEMGDAENACKYRDKIEIVEQNRKMDEEERLKEEADSRDIS